MPPTPRRAAALALAALLGATACAGRGRAAAAPRPTVPAPTAADLAPCCAEVARRVATDYRVAALARRRFTHAQLWAALAPAVRPPAQAAPGIRGAELGRLRVREVGRSAEGRPIRAVTFGSGPVTVLLWSQMHGDEPTATMALADLLTWFASPAGRGDPVRARLAAALTVVAVPMLNPDGAERFQRENAAGVDVNRDALRLATPEGRTLAALADSVRPAFGFNLHDQDPRVVAAPGGRAVAVALLAPPAGPDRAWGPTRAAARLVAAGLATRLEAELPGRVARYADAYTPTAFGEWMQARGTSTVLIEAGLLPGDPEKQRLRAVHVGALLEALDAIATGRWQAADPRAYDRLPTEGRERTADR